jgi:putative Ca2+/H+ antiporter (TMEM165/GDT1 family)
MADTASSPVVLARIRSTLSRGPCVADVLAAFVVVFLAELGDKTQLVALTLAGRYPAVKVLAALGGAILVLQTLSVTAGALVSEAVPDRAIAVGAGLLFLGFAVWTWRSAEDEDEVDADVRSRTPRAGLMSVAVAFFLAELGDKTMLTTAGLAADRGAVPVWIGSFFAMLAATAMAVLAGQVLTKRVTPETLRRIGAVAFAVVGVLTLASAAVG